jgi:hypothetical protein
MARPSKLTVATVASQGIVCITGGVGAAGVARQVVMSQKVVVNLP